MITMNNQIFRQRMGTLGAKSTQLKSTLEAAQKESLKALASAAVESRSDVSGKDACISNFGFSSG